MARIFSNYRSKDTPRTYNQDMGWKRQGVANGSYLYRGYLPHQGPTLARLRAAGRAEDYLFYQRPSAWVCSVFAMGRMLPYADQRLDPGYVQTR